MQSCILAKSIKNFLSYKLDEDHETHEADYYLDQEESNH